jgi:hypothetical protein
MKRIFILFVITMLAVPLFADEAILIDFSTLTADIHVKLDENDTDTKPNQNRQTLMDFSHSAGGSFTTEQKRVMKTSLAIENWEILLASSARNVTNISLSYTKEAPSKKYGTVMGVRVHFPVEPHNSWAHVKPPFEIPAFEPVVPISDDGTIGEPDGNGITSRSRFEGQADGPAYGVIKNVGVIKSVAVNVYGLNFPHGLTAVIIDNQENHKNMFMGYLRFDGWGELIWNNPAYIQEVRNRDIRLYSLYPASTPFIKFGGFILQRDAAYEGGDFIVYFKDVKVIYDKAVLDTGRDIDDEALWEIIRVRETARKTWEMARFGQTQVLRYLEVQKQAKEDEFTPSRENQDK